MEYLCIRLDKYIWNENRDIYLKSIYYQVLDGFVMLTQLNLLHNDIQPGKLLIINEFAAKIIDFKNSIIVNDETSFESSKGAMKYLAPERYKAFRNGEKKIYENW